MANYLAQIAGRIREVAAVLTSAGAADAGKIPGLDASGRLSATFLPVGIGADTASVIASEALAAGDLVNINPANGQVRKADATTSGREAMGFVLSAIASGAAATVYFEGSNTSVTGSALGRLYLSTTAGLATATPPSGTGQVVQVVGFGTSATSYNFQAGEGVILA